ncbi:MAG: DsbA family protein [Alphaproteobacteria bacterium]
MSFVLARRLLAVLLVACAVSVMGGAVPEARAAAPSGRLETPPPPPPVEMPVAVPAPERVLGDPDAPVTIIEYASMTCPHCRTFHVTVLPHLRSAYIDTGKVRLVFRDYPLDQLALAAAMVARCVGPDRSMAATGRLFETQATWMAAEDPILAIADVVQPFGLDEADVVSCVQDEAGARPVLEEVLHGREAYEVKSTPTFIINGERLIGIHPLATFEEKIREALR